MHTERMFFTSTLQATANSKTNTTGCTKQKWNKHVLRVVSPNRYGRSTQAVGNQLRSCTFTIHYGQRSFAAAAGIPRARYPKRRNNLKYSSDDEIIFRSTRQFVSKTLVSRHKQLITYPRKAHERSFITDRQGLRRHTLHTHHNTTVGLHFTDRIAVHT